MAVTGGSGVLWQDLIPPEVLGHVFVYLSKRDRFNARQTCRLWREVCHLPQFWRQGHVVLQGESKVQPVALYMKQHGTHIKDLKISLRNRSGKILTTAQTKSISHVVSKVCNTKELQLRRLMCHEFYFSDMHDYAWKKTILTSLKRMVERQEHLSVVVFTNSYLDKKQGLELLDALSTTKKTVTTILLKNLFHIRDLHVHECPRFLELLGRFKMLECLGLSYRNVTDTVLDQLIRTCVSLKRLLLDLSYYDGYGITSIPPPKQDWNLPVWNSPGLTVWMNLNSHYSGAMEMQHALSTVMPLAGFRLDMSKHIHESDYHVERRISEVASCINKNSLKTFIVIRPCTMKGPWKHSEALVELVQACGNITHLCLRMTVTLDSLQKVVAAAGPRDTQEDEEEGSSSYTTEAAPERSRLDIHVKRCVSDTVVGRSVLDRLSADYPFCSVHIGCEAPLCKGGFF